MFRLVLVLLTVSAVAHASLTPNGRIVGGTDANILEFPYQVSIQYKTSSGYTHICGGSIYSQRTIITTASCVHGFTENQLVIKVGIIQLSNTSPALTITSLIPCEFFNIINMDFDMALIILADPLTFSDKIQPITLATENPSGGDIANISGWGTLSEWTGGSISLPETLQKLAVTILSDAECKSVYPSYWITNQMICAGIMSGGHDACLGDNGGPLAIGNTLVGILSWGNGCGRPDAPEVYTSVAVLRSWIINNAVV